MLFQCHFVKFTIPFFFLIFIFESETDRQTDWEWGRSRGQEGDAESQAGSRLPAVSTESDMGLELTNCDIMTWAEVRCSTDWATQVLWTLTILNISFRLLNYLEGLPKQSKNWKTEHLYLFLLLRVTRNSKQNWTQQCQAQVEGHFQILKRLFLELEKTKSTQ